MKKILLLNGAKKFAHSDGRYNLIMHDTALAFFDRQGFEVKVTHIDEGYDIAEEVEKFLWADVIIYQMPGWWMGAPWIVKKYMDEVFTEGHGKLYASDGRTPFRRFAALRQRRPDSGQAVHAVADLERPAAGVR
ncbi:MAG: Modulator of drug activity B [Pseudomonas fragi]